MERNHRVSGTPQHRQGDSSANANNDNFTSATPVSTKLADMLLQLKATEGQIILASPYVGGEDNNNANNNQNQQYISHRFNTNEVRTFSLLICNNH